SAGASIRVNPRGAVNSTGIIRNSGNFKIFHGATVANGAGGLLATSGSLVDSGTLNVAQEASLNIDAGTVDINGSLDSSGSMRLSLPAVVRVDTQGKMSNAGVFGNFGGLYIEAGGTLTNVQGGAINTANILNNLGTVDNSAGATINNNKGGNISLYGFSYTNNAGAMNNGAAITKYCRAVMYTPGTLTGNPVTIVSCSSLRTTATSIRLSTSSVGAKQTISINATVVDTSTGAKALPTGALAWSDGKAGGVFALSGICTLSKGSCAISYAAPSAGGTITLNATYEGDMVHQPSSTAAQLTVTSQGTSTSTAGSSSSTSATSGTGAPAGGGGIPEFPAQLPGVAILTAFIVVAYLSLRRRVTG
ncbi:MAG TPA: hypothetical protein VKF15_00705, partial [Nitrososphaerales archaeon]|nr:hypothetical protein [Nitrososphaerales archaeon]